MDGLGIAAVLGGIGLLITTITTSWLQIQAANRTTAAVQEVVPLVTATATKVDEVHVLTNSNYLEQKELNAALQAKLDELVRQRDETALLALDATRHRLELAEAEVNRLNAAAPATPQAPLVAQPITKENPLPVEVVEPPLERNP